MKKLGIAVVILAAALIGFAVGTGDDAEPAPQPVAAPTPAIPPPPPGFVLEQPVVVDTSQTDRIQHDRAHAIQARRDAQVVADEVAAAEHRREAAAPTDY